jgi:hypothetical protein
MFKSTFARLLVVAMLLGVLAGALTSRAAAAAAPTLAVTPAQGPVGTAYVVTGQGWPASAYVLVTFGDPQKQLATWFIGAVGGYADAQGNLRLRGVIPPSYTSMSAGVQQVKPGAYMMVATIQNGPGAQTMFTVTGPSAPPPSPTGFEVAARFQPYYNAQQGLRLLGYAVSNEQRLDQTINGRTVAVPVQYFQKGRIEDHRDAGAEGVWAYMYGLLVPELLERAGELSISDSSFTYKQLQTLINSGAKVAPPPGFAGGTPPVGGQSDVFIPQSPNLAPAPGYLVAAVFWTYMNSGVFPAGWLHDLGLPISSTFTGTVRKNGVVRPIMMQAFERGILTYDAQNPRDFQVERANIGADYVYMLQHGGTPGQQPPAAVATDVVMTYWQQIGRKNYEAAYNLLAASYKQQVTLDQFRAQQSAAIASVIAVEVVEVIQQADGSLRLKTNITLQVGSQPGNYQNGPNTRFVTTVLENGSWRILGLSTSP